MKLGVNVDHVATLRQARGTSFPDPMLAAELAISAGADSITVHLREDRRHIQDYDVRNIREKVKAPLNLEMAATQEMKAFAIQIQPDECCIVPEKRKELTTEGGLNAAADIPRLKAFCNELTAHDIRVSLFVDPDIHQIEASMEIGAPIIEIHTGAYADAETEIEQKKELELLIRAVEYGNQLNLQVNAGHGLNYDNTAAIVDIGGIDCLNIGHSIVCRAVLTGMVDAVSAMKQILNTPKAE